jgi:dolichol-phosphate mannosyltransferase
LSNNAPPGSLGVIAGGEPAIAELELAVVVPTFNECENVGPLLESLARSLSGVRYEVIFVDDDSPDGTAEVVRAIGAANPQVRVLQRIRRRGLASACIEGMMATAAPYVAVMDADLQHDERILPQMLAMLRERRLDIVVATRNVEGGSMGAFARERVFLSSLGNRLSRSITRVRLSDPMSGFFLVDRAFLGEVVRSASGVGFKILLDLVASARRPLRIGEVPYTFRERVRGASKLDILVALEYLELLLDKAIGDIVPVRFIIFGLVGSVGVVLATAVLYVAMAAFQAQFLTAQAVATVVAMTANFFLNNITTYRDRRLRGKRLWVGLTTFMIACSFGAVINMRIAEFARGFGVTPLISGVCGLLVGAVWNYGVTSFTTWRHTRRARSPVPNPGSGYLPGDVEHERLDS